MHAEQVLDAQADLVTRMNTEVFQKYLGGSFGAGHHIMYPALQANTRAAYAYRVTPEMSTMVEWAASQLDETDRFDRDLPPTGAGFVRFDRPLPVADVRGRTMAAHWLIWGPTKTVTTGAFGQQQRGLGLWLFNDTFDPDEIGKEIIAQHGLDFVLRTSGRWGFIGAEMLFPGQQMGPALVDAGSDAVAKILADGDTPTPFTNATRYAVALWMLLNQTVTDVTEEHLRTGRRKSAQRKGIPGRVSVIALRRSSGAGRADGETLVQWSHRWVCRGHWRWQPYGAGRELRRRIWVRPFVKGPADKPLVITDKVYELRR